jgi:hypothetical protein
LALLVQHPTAPSFFKRGKKFLGAQKKRELWLNKGVYMNDRYSSTFFCMKNHLSPPRREIKSNLAPKNKLLFLSLDGSKFL